MIMIPIKKEEKRNILSTVINDQSTESSNKLVKIENYVKLLLKNLIYLYLYKTRSIV